MITTQDQYDFEEYSALYSATLNVSWPYNAADVVVSSGDELLASPVFEQHFMRLKNWNVGPAFTEKYPIIGAIIKESIEY